MNKNGIVTVSEADMDTRIRDAAKQDCDDIRGVHLQAFAEDEGKLIADLAVKLLSEPSHPETLNLVAEEHGKVVGHVAFSPVFSDIDKGWLGYILAPLAVAPSHHHVGIGSKLVEGGMARLSGQGVNMLFVYGDPKFYQRFGFNAETAAGFQPPYDLRFPFGWQAMVLNEEEAKERTTRLSCVAPLCDPALW